MPECPWESVPEEGLQKKHPKKVSSKPEVRGGEGECDDPVPQPGCMGSHRAVPAARKTWGMQVCFFSTDSLLRYNLVEVITVTLGRSRNRAGIPAGPEDALMAFFFTFSPTALNPKSHRVTQSSLLGAVRARSRPCCRVF